MKLNEKIYQCRRKAGLSQEALAERIGVSRQAISKWETGEAAPEISKLPLLAKTFGVTADWLLSEDDETAEDAAEDAPAPDAPKQPEPPRRQYSDEPVRTMPEWVDHLPGLLGRLIRKYGWLLGVYIAISGAGITALGWIARMIGNSMQGTATRQMNSMGSLFGGGTAWSNASGDFIGMLPNEIDPGTLGMTVGDFGMNVGNTVAAVTEPFMMMCSFIIGFGLVTLIAGIVLAVWLKKKGEQA